MGLDMNKKNLTNLLITALVILLFSFSPLLSTASASSNAIPSLYPGQSGPIHQAGLGGGISHKNIDCTVKPWCIYLTSLVTDDILIVKGGLSYAGEISVSSITIGAADDPSNGMVYVGGYGCECVIVINAKTEVVTTTISISSYGPASAVVYSTLSKMIYVATFSDPGYYVAIDPSTNKVVKAISACGYYAEFGDQLNKGDVYFANRETSSGYGCVDAINPTTNKIVASVSLTDDYAVGVAANSANKEVYVTGYECGCVYVYTSALKTVTTLNIGELVWGIFSNYQLQTVFVPSYYSSYGVFPIFKNDTVGKEIALPSGANSGCGFRNLVEVPGSELYVIKNWELFKTIDVTGFSCAGTHI